MIEKRKLSKSLYIILETNNGYRQHWFEDAQTGEIIFPDRIHPNQLSEWLFEFASPIKNDDKEE